MGQIVCTDKGILAVEQNKVLIPPTWNKTFAWGYADLSCRLGTYESDKVCIVYWLAHLILLFRGLDILLNGDGESPGQGLLSCSSTAQRKGALHCIRSG